MASTENGASPTKKQKTSTETENGHGHSHDHGEGHAEIVAIGTVSVGGAVFSIDREGQVASGKTTEFGVERLGGANVKPSAAWLVNPDGTKVCDEVSAEDHLSHWHFNVFPLNPIKRSKFVLRVGAEEAAIDFLRGEAPKNGGILS